MKQNEQNATQPLVEIDAAGLIDGKENETLPLDDQEARTGVPKLNFAKPLKIADHICSNTRQLVILACDCSGSMAGSKIDELNLARLALCQELAEPENKDGFYLGVIEFDQFAQVVVEPQSVLELQLPDSFARGGTCFDAGLDEVTDVVAEFQSRPNSEGWHFLRPQVLWLSDGHSPVSQDKINELQEIANVWCIAYGGDADQKTLSRIASDGQVHFVGIQGGELRNFLASVGKTLSEGLA